MSLPINFNAEVHASRIIDWAKCYFEREANINSKAVIGISSGKDSSICAAICARAIGAERVIGVQMPDGIQDDFDLGAELIEYLGIQGEVVNINPIREAMYQSILLGTQLESFSNVTLFNTPARIRMSVLYAISGSVSGRVCNTCNLSETWVGYDTKFGDDCGDFGLLNSFTKSEVIAIGRELLPDRFIDIESKDGLCGMSDEERFGFSYNTLDSFIRETGPVSQADADKIFLMHKASKHKRTNMPYPAYIANRI